MSKFTNCTVATDENGVQVITCDSCSTKYKITYDGIKAPYNERGVEKCQECGVELMSWRSRQEPYLEKID